MGRKNRGVALMTAMFVVMVLYFLCTVAARDAQQNLRFLRMGAERTQRAYLAKAGVNEAISKLMADLANQSNYPRSNPKVVTYDDEGVVVSTWVEPDPDSPGTLLQVHSDASSLGHPGEAEHFSRVVRIANPVAGSTLNAVMYLQAPNSNTITQNTLSGKGLSNVPDVPYEFYQQPAPSPGASPDPHAPYNTAILLPPAMRGGCASLDTCAFDSDTQVLYAINTDPQNQYWPSLLQLSSHDNSWSPAAPLPAVPGSDPPVPMQPGYYFPAAAANGTVYVALAPGQALSPSPDPYGSNYRMGAWQPPVVYSYDSSSQAWNPTSVSVSSFNIKLNPYTGKYHGCLVGDGTSWSSVGDPVSLSANYPFTYWALNDPKDPDSGIQQVAGSPAFDQLSICPNGDLVGLWQWPPGYIPSVLHYDQAQKHGELIKPLPLSAVPGAQPPAPFLASLPMAWWSYFEWIAPYYHLPKYVDTINNVFPSPDGQPIYQFGWNGGNYLCLNGASTPMALPNSSKVACVGSWTVTGGGTSGPQVVPVGSQ